MRGSSGISTFFTDTEVNNCFNIYHTSWITSGPKSNFICGTTPTMVGQKNSDRAIHTRAHKVTRYIKSGDQLKENEVKWFSLIYMFIERISSSETEAKREVILFIFGCSKMNSTLLITFLARQSACAKSSIHLCGVNNKYIYLLYYFQSSFKKNRG